MRKVFPISLSMVSKTPRLPLLDIARGIMVLVMIIYHALYLLQYVFGKITVFSESIFWQIFTATGGGIFIFIAGLSASLAWKKNLTPTLSQGERGRIHSFTRYCLKRTAILAIIAAAITFLTQKLEPNQLILFGILHFFAIGFLLLPVFVNLKKGGMILSLVLIVIGVFLFTREFGVDYLWIFGIRKAGFFSADYYPLLPFFGVLLLGFFIGKILIESGKIEKALSPDFPGSFPVRWLGKNTLVIYLVHVPVLYGIMWAVFVGLK